MIEKMTIEAGKIVKLEMVTDIRKSLDPSNMELIKRWSVLSIRSSGAWERLDAPVSAELFAGQVPDVWPYPMSAISPLNVVLNGPIGSSLAVLCDYRLVGSGSDGGGVGMMVNGGNQHVLAFCPNREHGTKMAVARLIMSATTL